MNYLSLCAIARDEDIYMDEFVCYYKLMGVEKFYIYDNGSKIPMAKTLAKYGDLVHVVDFPGEARQMPAYTHCINSTKKETEWLLVVDCDEFVVPKIKNTIPEILCDYDQPYIGGLGVNWKIFGSNGNLTKPDGLIIENYTKCMAKDNIHSNHIKTCLRPSRTMQAGGDPHGFTYLPGFTCVSENYLPFAGPFTNHSSSKIGINHYCLKSFEEYKINKLTRPRADTILYPGKTMYDFYKFDLECVEYDREIFKFIDPLKELITSHKM